MEVGGGGGAGRGAGQGAGVGWRLLKELKLSHRCKGAQSQRNQHMPQNLDAPPPPQAQASEAPRDPPAHGLSPVWLPRSPSPGGRRGGGTFGAFWGSRHWGFEFLGLGFRVQGLGLRVEGLGFRVRV